MTSGAEQGTAAQNRPSGTVAGTPDERLIVALDYASAEDALRTVDALTGVVSFYKVGLELFTAAGHTVVRELKARQYRVFLDLKMDDVVETITKAVRQVTILGVDFLTILGARATASAARSGRGGQALPKLLQVTLLTSMDDTDLRELGLVGEEGQAKFRTSADYVAYRAEQALEHGCDGLITSGQNVGALRQRFRKRNPILVCPGIRPAGTTTDEHKRPSTPFSAIRDGADYLVVGRPITQAPDPLEAAKRIVEEISRGLQASA